MTTTQEQPAHFVPLETPVGWPSFIHHPGAEYHGPGIYGLGSADGIKIGEHGTGPKVEPATRDYLPDPAGIARLRTYAARWLPGVDPATASATTCLYTTTPDHNFVIDRRRPDHRGGRVFRSRLQVRPGHRRIDRRPGERNHRRT